jgi:serine/threonine protein kinase
MGTVPELRSLEDRFEVLRSLGRGASGAVYLAQERELNRRVALKVLDPRENKVFQEARARFQREVELMVRHPHPAIVPVYDADLAHEPPYLVTRHMEGGDLRQRLRPGGLPPTEVAALGARLARGLQHLHEVGVLHRDVKLSNVLQDETGEVYLSDLGLGVAVTQERLTRTGYVVGSPSYMAPEIIEFASYSPASDIFALAIVLAELAIGEEIGKPAALEDRASKFTAEVPDMELRRILRMASRTLPKDRFASAAKLAGRLERRAGVRDGGALRTNAGADETTTREVPRQEPRRSSSRPEPTSRARIALPALALMAVLAAVLGVRAWWTAPEPPPAAPEVIPGAEARDRYREQLDVLLEGHRAPGGAIRSALAGDGFDAHRQLVVRQYQDARYPIRWRRMFRALGDYLKTFGDGAKAREALGEELDAELYTALEHLSEDRAMIFSLDWASRIPGGALPEGLRDLDRDDLDTLTARQAEVQAEVARALEEIPAITDSEPGPHRQLRYLLWSTFDVERPGSSGDGLASALTELEAQEPGTPARLRLMTSALAFLPETFGRGDLPCDDQADLMRRALEFLDEEGAGAPPARLLTLRTQLTFRWVSFRTRCGIHEFAPPGRLARLLEEIEADLAAAPWVAAVHLRHAIAIETSMTLIGAVRGIDAELRHIGKLERRADALCRAEFQPPETP